MQAFVDWPYEHPALFFSIFAICLLVLHLASFRFKGFSLILIAIILIAISFLFVGLVYRPEPAAFSTVVALLFLYGCGLFVFLSELLLGGVGRFLTRKRGEKWIKEMDYFYLSIGVLGVLFSLNRIDILSGRFEGTDIVAPLLLTTAIVFRFIRTRAELGKWNELKDLQRLDR
jgi:hypothetical protein